MKRAGCFLVPLMLAAVAGCAAQDPDDQIPTPINPAPIKPAAKLPAEPEPVDDGPCPYLDSSFVADANGQRVSKVRVSADQPHPACFFYRGDGSVQLTVRVYLGTAELAKALVDQSAPISTSNPADSPSGWKGGSLSKDDGAVYAVAKDEAAVVVSTNQPQSIKARRVAEETIAALDL